MLVILSGAKDLAIAMSASEKSVTIHEAKVVQRKIDIITPAARSLAVCAARDDNAIVRST